jgi:hypothetical protein
VLIAVVHDESNAQDEDVALAQEVVEELEDEMGGFVDKDEVDVDVVVVVAIVVFAYVVLVVVVLVLGDT